VNAWVEKNVPWLGYVIVAIVGGIVAHIRQYENINETMTLRQHMWALARRGVMAILAGLMWYWIISSQGLEDKPLSYVGASLVGLFAPEFFDLLWDLFKRRLTIKSDKDANA